MALAIDSNDALHIAGYDSDNKDIIYLACTSSCTSTSSWSNISAVTTGEVGGRLSIAVDSTNNPHISYQNGVFGISSVRLGYATCTSSCLTASSFWTHGTVDGLRRFPVVHQLQSITTTIAYISSMPFRYWRISLPRLRHCSIYRKSRPSKWFEFGLEQRKNFWDTERTLHLHDLHHYRKKCTWFGYRNTDHFGQRTTFAVLRFGYRKQHFSLFQQTGCCRIPTHLRHS